MKVLQIYSALYCLLILLSTSVKGRTICSHADLCSPEDTCKTYCEWEPDYRSLNVSRALAAGNKGQAVWWRNNAGLDSEPQGFDVQEAIDTFHIFADPVPLSIVPYIGSVLGLVAFILGPIEHELRVEWIRKQWATVNTGPCLASTLNYGDGTGYGWELARNMIYPQDMTKLFDVQYRPQYGTIRICVRKESYGSRYDSGRKDWISLAKSDYKGNLKPARFNKSNTVTISRNCITDGWPMPGDFWVVSSATDYYGPRGCMKGCTVCDPECDMSKSHGTYTIYFSSDQIAMYNSEQSLCQLDEIRRELKNAEYIMEQLA